MPLSGWPAGLMGFGLVLAWPVAYGQEPPAKAGAEDTRTLKALSLEELSKIEISTVTKEPSPAFRTPAAIHVLTQEDIRRSGATNLPDLLRLVPGVEVAQIDSGKWAIGIRGFEGRLSKSVLVLIDGRSVYTPLFAGVYWEMQDTMLEDIDRIEVIRGPAGTIWGANAVNGVINIITKSAMDTRGTLVSAGGGNVEQGFLRARYGWGNDHLSYRAYGTGFTRGPQYHPDGREFDDWRRGAGGIPHGLESEPAGQPDGTRQCQPGDGGNQAGDQHLFAAGTHQRGRERVLLRAEPASGMAAGLEQRIGRSGASLL